MKKVTANRVNPHNLIKLHVVPYKYQTTLNNKPIFPLGKLDTAAKKLADRIEDKVPDYREI